MAEKTEGKWAGEAIVSEAQAMRSRDQITILSGEGVLSAQIVLGKALTGAGSSAAVAGNTGNGVMGAITVGAGAKPGVYKLVIVEPGSNAGKFTVEDPDGITIGVGTVAVAFSAGGIGFTLADGGTDFASGDGFDITVAAGSGKYKAWDPAGTDGSQIAAGILYDGVDATSADVKATGHVRDCEFNKAELAWKGTPTDNQKAAAYANMASLGMIGR